jgi:tetratricopeptide (TPR) repeat protein
MKIYATVLLGPGSEKSVAGAIQSAAARVDGFLLIESGGGDLAVMAATDAVIESQASATLREFRWTGSYAEARQFALDAARDIEGGCDYAVTLDPDERLELPDNLRDLLQAHPEIAVWTLVDRDEGYHKERIIRCSSGARWHGRVCENIELPEEQDRGRMRGHFWELPKDEAATTRRYERGVVECRRMIAEGDDRYKWRRHLGSCLLGLGKRREAIEEFTVALSLAESDEERAWVSYLLCEHDVIDEQYEAAQARAADGLRRHAGFLPEFGWIFAFCQYKAGHQQNASRWAQLVVSTPPDRTRVSFRSKNAHRGSRQILAALHGAPVGGHRILRDIVLPITDRFSATMVQAIESGVYEAAERDILEALLAPGDRLLELGAGCGYLATVAAKKLGSGSVVTVEADPEMAPTIQKTFEVNEVSPLLIVGAVGKDSSPKTVERAPDFWSTKTRPGGETPGLAFGALLRAHSPTVLAIDIEGGEAELCGEALPEGVRAVLIEAHGQQLDDDVTRWLVSEGYRVTRAEKRTLLFQRAA